MQTEDHRSHKEIMEEVVLQSKKKKAGILVAESFFVLVWFCSDGTTVRQGGRFVVD